MEKIEQLPSNAPFSERFEEIVGEACESAAAGRGDSTCRRPRVRAIDLRYLERWDRRRRKPALKQMGVDEINYNGSVCPPSRSSTTNGAFLNAQWIAKNNAKILPGPDFPKKALDQQCVLLSTILRSPDLTNHSGVLRPNLAL